MIFIGDYFFTGEFQEDWQVLLEENDGAIMKVGLVHIL